MATFKCGFVVERDDEEIELDATGTYSSDPGRRHGPPENCYPPEEDFEYALTLDGKPWDGELTKEEEGELRTLAISFVEDDCDPPEPDYDDDSDYEDPYGREAD